MGSRGGGVPVGGEQREETTGGICLSSRRHLYRVLVGAGLGKEINSRSRLDDLPRAALGKYVPLDLG